MAQFNQHPPYSKPSNTAASQRRVLAFFRRFVQDSFSGAALYNKPSMKNILTSLLIAGLVLMPSLSFAATYTPAQISATQQLLSLLETELQTLLAQQPASSTPACPSGKEYINDSCQWTVASQAALNSQQRETTAPTPVSTASYSDYLECKREDQQIPYFKQGAAGAEQQADIERCETLEESF